MPSRSSIARPKLKAAYTAIVSRHYTMSERRFDIAVERIGRGHIAEGRAWWAEDVPLLGEHHDLAQLPTCGVVVWAEGAVRVTRYDAPLVCRLYERIKRVSSRNVKEGRSWRRVQFPTLCEHYY